MFDDGDVQQAAVTRVLLDAERRSDPLAAEFLQELRAGRVEPIDVEAIRAKGASSDADLTALLRCFSPDMLALIDAVTFAELAVVVLGRAVTTEQVGRWRH